MAYVDKLKYDNFARNRDEQFANSEAVNFEMIYKKINGGKVPREMKKNI